MSRSQKILTTALWGLLVLVMVSVIGAGWWKHEPRFAADDSQGGTAVEAPTRGEILFRVPPFALVDQDNQPVTDQTLRGTPWVAAFIFTNCAGPCPMMSSNMAKLLARVPHPDLKLVSFTVDPQRDTPDVLKEYARNLKADESRWSFVTGSPQAMADVARGMLMAAVPATETADITHSTKFLLVDKKANVRGIYAPDEMEQLATDAAALTGQVASAAGSPPSGLPSRESPSTRPAI